MRLEKVLDFVDEAGLEMSRGNTFAELDCFVQKFKHGHSLLMISEVCVELTVDKLHVLISVTTTATQNEVRGVIVTDTWRLESLEFG